MYEHPIEGLMTTAMNSIRDMIDVNTIIGEAVQAPGNITIIPISKVGFGFASGGSEFKGETLNEYTKKEQEEQAQYRLPFGGGSGAGVSINPISFLVVQQDKVKLLPVNHSSCIDKILDYVPEVMDKIEDMVGTKEDKNNIKENSKEKIKSMHEQNDTNMKRKKAKLSKIPKTTAEELEKKKGNKQEDDEAIQELEDMFEQEYEYDDE